MSTAIQMPLSQRINVRMIVLFAVISLPFIWFTTVFVRQTMSKGIEYGSDFATVDLKALGNFQFNPEIDTDRGGSSPLSQTGRRVQLEGFMYSSSGAMPWTILSSFTM